jgi:hypothetical protein
MSGGFEEAATWCPEILRSLLLGVRRLRGGCYLVSGGFEEAATWCPEILRRLLLDVRRF